MRKNGSGRKPGRVGYDRLKLMIKGYEGSERWRPPPFAAANVGVLRPDYAIVVGIPILDVLLDHLRLCVSYDWVRRLI